MIVEIEDTQSKLAQRTADAIADAFTAYHKVFGEITRRAKGRFEARDFSGLHKDAEARLDLHGACVNKIVGEIGAALGAHVEDRALWVAVKEAYTQRIAERSDFDLAQSFYNSVTKRVVATVGMDPDVQYMGTELQPPPCVEEGPVFTVFPRDSDTQALVQAVLESYSFDCGYKDLKESASLAAAEIDRYLLEVGWEQSVISLEIARPIFYRGEIAFLVGRICNSEGYVPVTWALVNTPEGVVVDAVLLTEDEVSIIFSFARWYFHVDAEKPYALVRFLKSILPRKPVAELYISIGYNKHGKTELYRNLIRHLQRSTDQFEIAPGERGMVMVVFTLPSYDVVFKMIKDTFDYPKTTTKREVKSRYHLVFKHDRGGRLVDAQEFEHLRFPKARFSPELLEELLRVASNTVSVEGDEVAIKHLYTERRLIPLNMYIRETPYDAAAEAVVDYGQAIKDLAITNIFPGDILLKNFGVTRHGRVVFYDYDELCLLTDCKFREMPQSSESDEELYAEPWFSVGEYDVFPEELHTFLGLPPDLKAVFHEAHGELFTVEFWTKLQACYKGGGVLDVFPYKEQRRLSSVT